METHLPKNPLANAPINLEIIDGAGVSVVSSFPTVAVTDRLILILFFIFFAFVLFVVLIARVVILHRHVKLQGGPKVLLQIAVLRPVLNLETNMTNKS